MGMPATRHALFTVALLMSAGAILLPLGGCEDSSVSLGYGLPRNDFCRAAAEQPGKPINSDCLDSIGH